MLAGLRSLFGVAQANGGEGLWRRPGGPVRAVSGFESSDDHDVEVAFQAYYRDRGQAEDPFFQAVAQVRGRLVTHTREQLVPDRVWFRSSSYVLYRAPARIAHELSSIYEPGADGRMSILAFVRTASDRPFSVREQRLLKFFHLETGRLLGGALASATEPGPDSLSPRLRQTLACLLEGDSEKQVAQRLGLSMPTVHQYVTMLYRHFGVHSRAQLLVHAMQRSRNEHWRNLTNGER